MAEHTLDLATFRLLFPAFADSVDFPDAQIQAFWSVAGTYLPTYDNFALCGPTLQNALNFMTAHLLLIATQAARALAGTGSAVAIVTQATVDKVTVQVKALTTKSAWDYWLSMTPYGLELLALLRRAAAGGFYFGGSLARAGFRGPLG